MGLFVREVREVREEGREMWRAFEKQWECVARLVAVVEAAEAKAEVNLC